MPYKIYAILITLIFSTAGNSFGQKFSEYEVKLAYMYQIVKYFNWPETNNKSDVFTIGFYGEYNLQDLPNKMFNNRKFNGKPSSIKIISTENEAKNCDLVFIMGIDKFETLKLLKALNHTSVLTIGDQLEDFCELGGIINFTAKTEKQRIELSIENIKNANLEVSNQLYAISKIVTHEDVF